MKQSKRMPKKIIEKSRQDAQNMTNNDLKKELKLHQNCLKIINSEIMVSFRECDKDLPGWGMIELHQTGIEVCEDELKARRL